MQSVLTRPALRNVLVVFIVVVSACSDAGATSTTESAVDLGSTSDRLEEQLVDLQEQVKELEGELERAEQLSDHMREWDRASYDRVVAEKNQLIAQVAQWASFADSIGYDLKGAEYGWEHAPRRSCGSHVSGRLTESGIDLRAGPILLAGALTYTDQSAEVFEPVDDDLYHGLKILAVVDAGETVLVVVPPEEADRMSLLWTMRGNRCAPMQIASVRESQPRCGSENEASCSKPVQISRLSSTVG